MACVDDGEQAQAVSTQALAIACSLGLEVTFARVIEAQGHFASPADPIEWQMRRRAQRENLRDFADRDEEKVLANSVLLAGVPADELSDWAQDHGATMLAVGRRRSDQGKGLGSTAQALLERADHSLLLVPPGTPKEGGYRRIMIPIDGSARADSVLPIARRIARTHGADLVLVHIVPRLEVVGGANAPHVEQSRDRIEAHNYRRGSQHLEDLRRRSVEDGVKVTAITRGPGDPRSLLSKIADEEHVDLIVMASHGNTGLQDVACGSVAEYLAGHSPVPLLMVRPNIKISSGLEPASCRDAAIFRFEE
ncbi:universal stress protein [Qipengyuania sp. CAU 1752]